MTIARLKNRPELIQQVITIREAADMLAVSPLTIRRAIKTGKIRAFQFNPKGPYRISLEEILKFISTSTSSTEKNP